MKEAWQEFAVYPDAASAHVVAERLRSEDVPVDVVIDQPVPGLLRSARLLVPEALLHRARWVLANSQFTDEELAALAIDAGEKSGDG